MKRLTGLTVKSFCWLLLASLIVHVPHAVAVDDELDASKKRLGQIQQQIDETLKGLREKKSQSGALSEELSRLATETRKIERLTQKSKRQLSELAARLEKQRNILNEIDIQRVQTEQQIRHRLVVLYKTGEVGLIKALLTEAESPHELAEKYAFLSRMVRYDRQLLDEYRQQTIDHRTLLSDLEALRNKQSALVARRRQEEEALHKARSSKQRLLAEVKQDAALLEGVVQDLRAKASRLNELVKKLETEQTQPYTANLEGLLPHKGRLLWPVPGDLKVGFGTSRHGDLGTLIESNGFDIEAEVGTPVKAASAGKVIFANRLRGYGKLMIIDHGAKYYTLYAHIASFAKKVGDPVAAGEILAYSGFEGRDAVYFEIRLGGKPLDPADWLEPR